MLHENVKFCLRGTDFSLYIVSYMVWNNARQATALGVHSAYSLANISGYSRNKYFFILLQIKFPITNHDLMNLLYNAQFFTPNIVRPRQANLRRRIFAVTNGCYTPKVFVTAMFICGWHSFRIKVSSIAWYCYKRQRLVRPVLMFCTQVTACYNVSINGTYVLNDNSINTMKLSLQEIRNKRCASNRWDRSFMCFKNWSHNGDREKEGGECWWGYVSLSEDCICTESVFKIRWNMLGMLWSHNHSRVW